MLMWLIVLSGCAEYQDEWRHPASSPEVDTKSGPQMRRSLQAVHWEEPEPGRERFGTVFSPGDVNGDGFTDLFVNGPLLSGGASGHLYLGQPVDTGPMEHMVVPDVGEWSTGVDGGDINGDGYDDLILSDADGTDIGSARVHFGSSRGLDGSQTQRIRPENWHELYRFGPETTAIGDVNGDGYADVAVQAAHVFPNRDSTVYVYLGSAGGVDLSSELQLDFEFRDVELLGTWSLDDMSGMGDLNGDGWEDFGVLTVEGLHTADGTYHVGVLHVFYGSANGLDPDSPTIVRNVETGPLEYAGGEIQRVGDVNGDGFADVVVSVGFADRVPVAVPWAYVFLGGPDGLIDGRGLTLYAPVSQLPGTYLTSVAGVGDFDGDGLDDVLVVHNRRTSIMDSMRSAGYLFTGHASGRLQFERDTAVYPTVMPRGWTGALGLGDVDGNGEPDYALSSHVSVDGVYSGFEVVVSGELCIDDDEDGYCLGRGDCDDTDPAIHEGAAERVGDGVDQNCDGIELCLVDADDDGFTAAASATVTSNDVDCTDPGEALASAPSDDCDDEDPTRNPGATERPGDNVDQDCDGTEWCFMDTDADGFLPSTDTVVSLDADCNDEGEAVVGVPTGDCDDADPSVHPLALEGVGDEVDQNCDGREQCFVDADGDGFRLDAAVVWSANVDCSERGEAGVSAPAGDCDDTDPNLYPGATEVVGDGIDQNCDGLEECFVDEDADGFAADFEPRLSTDEDCNDPGEAGASTASGDCDDLDPSIYPGAQEAANDGVDQDCDGLELCAVDRDGDGYTDGISVVLADPLDCVGLGLALDPAAVGDCDDTDPTRYPGAAEVVGDGIDQDCDGADAEREVRYVAGGMCSCRHGMGGDAGFGLLVVGCFAAMRRRKRAGGRPGLIGRPAQQHAAAGTFAPPAC